MAVDWYEYSNTNNTITIEKVIKLVNAWNNHLSDENTKTKHTPQQNNDNEKGTTRQLVERIQYKYIHEKITMKEGTRLFGSQWPTSGRVAAFAAASSTLLEYSTAADTNVSKPLI